MGQKRQFDYGKWDFDLDGEAYIIAKDQCPDRDMVPLWIVVRDNLSHDILRGNPRLTEEDVKEGWCKFQVRTDWDNCEGEPMGGYAVIEGARVNQSIYQWGDKLGKRKPGWFPVWIVRVGDWY